MREILFRGKRKYNGEWIEGGYCHKKVGEYLTEVYIAEARTDYVVAHYRVDPETVGEYTGMLDKNGKRIFEGDIVESCFTKKPYLVCFGEFTYVDEYGEKSHACGWYNEEDEGLTGMAETENWATIIGNIHDNPELMEVRDGKAD